MSKYRRLTRDERNQIQGMVASGLGVRAVGRLLQRSPSTVSEELRRCGLKEYLAETSERLVQERRRRCRSQQKRIKGELKNLIIAKLEKQWSPEQIQEWLRDFRISTISYSTIYRMIEKEEPRLKRNLRILRKQRKDRKKPQYKPKKDLLPPREYIDQRPKIVEERNRLGDYERDTVLGKRNGPVLLTIVDRTTRRVKIACVPKLNAENIHRATLRKLQDEPCETITNDNGIEFHYYRKTAEALSTKIYFSRAYRAWERGTNENTNGLLRQYFPKKRPIPMLTPEQEREYENLLNDRPRKCLGFKTPNQIYKSLKGQVFG